jgi:hypothetical protein
MGDLIRSRNTAVMFDSLRSRLAEIFTPYLGATIMEILPGKQYSERWEARFRPFVVGTPKEEMVNQAVKLLQELEGEETEAERYEKRLLTTTGELEFGYLLDEEVLENFEEINKRFSQRVIQKITIDRNWVHNSLGANLSYKFDLGDGVTMDMSHWTGFNPEEMTFQGRPLHPEFLQHGDVIELSAENSQDLVEEVASTLYNAFQAAQSTKSEPLVLPLKEPNE